MDEKYLPIGTICRIGGNLKLIMVTGYFSIEYNGQVKMYDYSGCVYPEGLLSSNKQLSFNHSDIEKVEYIGLKNDDYNKFNNILIQQNNNNSGFENKQQVMKNIKFDENGVVIFDSFVQQDNQIVNNVPVKNNPFEIKNQTTNNINQDYSIFKNLKFDENGVVISDDISANKNQVNDINIIKSSNNQIKFDKNGMVIADGIQNDHTNGIINQNSSIKFDENGMVIAD